MQPGDLTTALAGGAYIQTGPGGTWIPERVKIWFDTAISHPILGMESTSDFAGIFAELAVMRAAWLSPALAAPGSLVINDHVMVHTNHFDYFAEELQRRCDHVNAGPMLQEYLQQIGIPHQAAHAWLAW